METSQSSTKPDLSDETLLQNVAGILLLAGILSAIVLGVTIGYVTVEGEYSFETKTYINWGGIVAAFMTGISSIALWAFLRVIANISTSLKSR